MLVWDPQEGYDHVLNGVRHHFDSVLQRKRKIAMPSLLYIDFSH